MTVIAVMMVMVAMMVMVVAMIAMSSCRQERQKPVYPRVGDTLQLQYVRQLARHYSHVQPCPAQPSPAAVDFSRPPRSLKHNF